MLQEQGTNNHRVLYIAWSIFLPVCLLLLLYKFPFRLISPSDDNIFIWMVEAQLFFAILIFPLFLTHFNPDLKFLIDILVMLIIGLPFLAISSDLSPLNLRQFLKLLALVIFSITTVGFLFSLFRLQKINITPFYLLLIFLSQALLPFCNYLFREFKDVDYSLTLSRFSPFWTVYNLELYEPNLKWQIIILAVLTVLLALPVITLSRPKTAQN